MVAPDSMNARSALAKWLVLAVILLTLGGVIAANLYLEYHRTALREQERLLAQARVVAENMESQLGVANQALLRIRSQYSAPAGVPSRQVEMGQLQSITNILPGVRTINVMDAQGRIVGSNRPELIGADLSYREYFRTVKNRPDRETLYVSPPFETLLGVYAINIARMIPGPRGEFAGLVSATLNPEYFSTLMASVLYAPDMWDAMAHGGGQLFQMQPEHKELRGMNLAQPGSFFTLHRESGQETSVMSGKVYSTGEKRMMAQRTLNPAALRMDQPLVVAVSRDLDAVFQLWRSQAIVQAILFGVIALISTLGLHVYLRRQQRLERKAVEARELADRFSFALDRISAYIYMKDRQRRYVYANQPTLELFGCTEAELPGSDDSRFFPPATVTQLHDIDTRVLEHGEDTAGEVIAQGPAGRRVYWEVKTPIYEDAERTRIWGLCGISTDITERRQQEEALQESEQRFRSTFDAAAIGMALVSPQGRFMQVNGALCRLLGYTPEELRQKTSQEITHPDDRDADQALARELQEGTRVSYQMEKRYFHKDGHVLWIWLSRSVVRDPGGKMLYSIAQIEDITERKNLLDRLEQQAHLDYLTGLSNRRHFIEQGEIELARVQRYGEALSVFMLDIDHFKQFNDNHGHKAGDAVLQKLAQLLRATLRTVDSIGRMGGEEFAVLLPETGQQEALEVAERLRERIAQADVVLEGGLPLHFTVSIGVATLQAQETNLDMLLNQADQALYQAKSAGRNRVCAAA